MSDFIADIIVIAGTYDARQIISRLSQNNIKVAATVTTSFGRELIDRDSNVRVYEKVLSKEEMNEFILKSQVKCLIDASHPYAEVVSLNAMDLCKNANISYLRFERKVSKANSKKILYAKDYNEAAHIAKELPGNILLTTGSKTLDIFLKMGEDFVKRLYVRILPDSKVIAKCEEAGLSKGNIIAMKGPFSEEFNIDMLKHIDAKIMVTKDSGDIGGTDEKINAALKLDVITILIERPQINYEMKVSDIEEVVKWTKKMLE